MTMPALMMLKLMLPLSARAAGAANARPATAASAIKAVRNRCETRMVMLSLLPGVRLVGGSLAYFPAALRSAALMRSCQPGPSSWKKSSTSRSMRSDTISFTPGSDGAFAGCSAGLVVAALKAFSASERESPVGRLAMPLFITPVCPPSGLRPRYPSCKTCGVNAAIWLLRFAPERFPHPPVSALQGLAAVCIFVPEKWRFSRFAGGSDEAFWSRLDGRHSGVHGFYGRTGRARLSRHSVGYHPCLPDLRLRFRRPADPVQLPDHDSPAAELRRGAACQGSSLAPRTL